LAQVGLAAASALVAALGDDRAAVRAAAAWSLGVIAANAPGEPALLRPAFEALEVMLDDPDPPCRAVAADSLGRFGDEALPALWRGLRSSRVEHRESARLLSARLGPAAVQGLLVLAREDESTAQLEAVGCLRAISTPAAVFGLAELADPRGTARPRL
jgi:HEAT repeat protein